MNTWHSGHIREIYSISVCVMTFILFNGRSLMHKRRHDHVRGIDSISVRILTFMLFNGSLPMHKHRSGHIREMLSISVRVMTFTLCNGGLLMHTWRKDDIREIDSSSLCAMTFMLFNGSLLMHKWCKRDISREPRTRKWCNWHSFNEVLFFHFLIGAWRYGREHATYSNIICGMTLMLFKGILLMHTWRSVHTYTQNLFHYVAFA